MARAGVGLHFLLELVERQHLLVEAAEHLRDVICAGMEGALAPPKVFWALLASVEADRKFAGLARRAVDLASATLADQSMLWFAELLLELLALLLEGNVAACTELQLHGGKLRAAEVSEVVESRHHTPSGTLSARAIWRLRWPLPAIPREAEEEPLLIELFALFAQWLKERCP